SLRGSAVAIRRGLRCVAAGAVGLACNTAAAGRPPLAPYDATAAALFDDEIEPRAIGLELVQGVDARRDAKLRERVQTGDETARVQVTTVTARGSGADPSYQISLRVVEAVVGHGPGSLSVVPNRASVGLVRSFEGQLVGKRFIAFLRQFVLSD